MIGSLVRWLGRGAGRGSSGRGSGPARRFTPQLEALEDRAVPGGAAGGVADVVSVSALLGAKVSSPSHVIPFGSKPAGGTDGILSGFAITPARHDAIGEEIPQ
jgi:hypothetical protein